MSLAITSGLPARSARSRRDLITACRRLFPPPVQNQPRVSGDPHVGHTRDGETGIQLAARRRLSDDHLRCEDDSSTDRRQGDGRDRKPQVRPCAGRRQPSVCLAPAFAEAGSPPGWRSSQFKRRRIPGAVVVMGPGGGANRLVRTRVARAPATDRAPKPASPARSSRRSVGRALPPTATRRDRAPSRVS